VREDVQLRRGSSCNTTISGSLEIKLRGYEPRDLQNGYELARLSNRQPNAGQVSIARFVPLRVIDSRRSSILDNVDVSSFRRAGRQRAIPKVVHACTDVHFAFSLTREKDAAAVSMRNCDPDLGVAAPEDRCDKDQTDQETKKRAHGALYSHGLQSHMTARFRFTGFSLLPRLESRSGPGVRVNIECKSDADYVTFMDDLGNRDLGRNYR
jgi:hypothetical protein